MAFPNFNVPELTLAAGAVLGALFTIIKFTKAIVAFVKKSINRWASHQQQYEDQMLLLNKISNSVKPNGGPGLWEQVKSLRSETSDQYKIIRQEIAIGVGLSHAMMHTQLNGIFQASNEGKWIFINYALSNLLGLSMLEAANDGWRSSIIPSDRERVIEEWDSAVSQKRIFNLSFTVRNSTTGKLTDVMATSILLRDNHTDEIIGSIGHFTIIT